MDEAQGGCRIPFRSSAYSLQTASCQWTASGQAQGNRMENRSEETGRLDRAADRREGEKVEKNNRSEIMRRAEAGSPLASRFRKMTEMIG